MVSPFDMGLLDLTTQDMILIGSILLGAILLGIIFEKFIFKYLNRFAAKRRLDIWRIMIKTLRGETFIWIITGALYLTLLTLRDATVIEQGSTIDIIIFDAIIVVLILSVAWFLGQVLLNIIEFYTRRGVIPRTSIFPNIGKLIVLSLTLLLVLDQIGVSIQPLVAALGVGGIAIALALQQTLANMFSGISILSTRLINPGDFVRLESGEEGFVEDIDWRNITVRSLENTVVIIPNNRISQMIVTNYHLPKTEINVFIPVGVSYDSDLNKVEQVTIEVGREIMQNFEGGIPEWEPIVRFEKFSDSSINFNVILQIENFEYKRRLKHEFIKKLHERYKKEDIEIPFPIRTVRILENEENLPKS